ncbi:GspE/PulE family protein [Fimbriimonas ginsengisoli]|uniref:Type IV fimbrial assembly, ATPase PilB n=1 Tax=Fimbriimonas ginsengisoli Gsoil 348 TaxID=661478 RepID=A0A068NRB7_FIMGI|nr:ATPase, T2SS/T4P/T4SS family [Fimbriimonas ginsengisoli]AIE85981.1 Type IV fimbrial assembly, ATPase PilB [Fimbriimonas ginsengisoli Gsoil 348]
MNFELESPVSVITATRSSGSLRFVDLETVKPLSEALSLAPPDFALKNKVLPLYLEGDVLVVAIPSEASLGAVDDLGVLIERPIRAVLADPLLINNLIEERFIEGMLAGLPQQDEGTYTEIDENADLNDLQQMAAESAVVQMVNLIFSQAIRDNASDIHIEPYERELRVRCRMDGIMHEVIRPPKRMHAALISRLKILAELNIAERRLPQDGRIKLQISGRAVDVRISIVPTIYGERAVMRILDKGSSIVGLEEIGMAPDILTRFRRLIRQPHGMVLVTGPTGSGKSTTLYGGLTELTSPTTNILTIEDPVEYQIFGVGQIQVRPAIGLTFANGLRSIVRQDPDIIMVGEIRDHETAEIAIHAALTGHMVFSTLHTNDSAGAITRLLDMGVEPFLAASSIIAVVAQRLVRRNCPNCSKPAAEDEVSATIGISTQDLKGRHLIRGTGCEKCAGTGFKGRVGLYELLVIDEAIKKMITDHAPASTIKNYATEHLHMRTLVEDGRRTVLNGLTTAEEVLRVCQREEL